MIVAIYARKATEQNGVAEEAKSVTRQIEHAQAYAVKRGWTIKPDSRRDGETDELGGIAFDTRQTNLIQEFV